MVELKVGLGSINMSAPLHEFIVTEFLMHPFYDNHTKNNDIALFKLPQAVKFSCWFYIIYRNIIV